MIAGETEMLLADYITDDTYDDFLFFGNKEKKAKRKAARKARRIIRRAAPKRIARRQRRRDSIAKLGQIKRDLGGWSAIGNAIDTISRPRTTGLDPIGIAPNQPGEIPSDFTLDVGTDPLEQSRTATSTMVLYGVLGVVVVGGLVLLYKTSNKKEYVNSNQN